MDFEDKLKAFIDEKVDAIGAYHCPRCDKEHVALEVAFRYPDVAALLGVPTDKDPDDMVVIGGRRFVRGLVCVPITDGKPNERLAIGIWLELDAADRGRIANQVSVFGPLFGADARVIAGPPGHRPTFELVEHPAAKAQRTGIPLAVANEIRAREAHWGEPEPRGVPFVAKIATHGWELHGAAALAKPAYQGELKVGDLAKIYVELETAGEDGNPSIYRAGWWLALDHVERDRVSGTLASTPRVVATLTTGTRIWAARAHIFDRGQA